MKYFNEIPNTTYELNGVDYVVKDLIKRVAFISEYKPYSDLFTSYTIVDGDTPQSIAQEVYGSVNYYWVVLIFNEIHNQYYEWPMDPIKLDAYCEDKYGRDVMFMTRHWSDGENVVGQVKEFKKGVTWVPPATPGNYQAVSFFDHEASLNDQRRNINILKKELLSDFAKQFKDRINE